jgi:predicted transcriptional regulator
LKLEHTEDDSKLQQIKEEPKLKDHNSFDPLKRIKQKTPPDEDEDEDVIGQQQLYNNLPKIKQEPASDEEEEVKKEENEEEPKLSPDNLKYVKRIKIMGGTYAILFALFLSPKSDLTKQELRSLDSAADAFCGGKGKLALTENTYNIETYEGSWHSGIKHLEEKGLVRRRCGSQREQHQFSLTHQGHVFIEELLRTQDSLVAKTILKESRKKKFYSSLDPKKIERINAMESVTRATTATATKKIPAENDPSIAKGQTKMTSFFSIKR